MIAFLFNKTLNTLLVQEFRGGIAIQKHSISSDGSRVTDTYTLTSYSPTGEPVYEFTERIRVRKSFDQ